MNFEGFRQDLIAIVNNCGLPLGGAYYVLKDVLRELEAVYAQELSSATPTIKETSQKMDPVGMFHEDGTPLTEEERQAFLKNNKEVEKEYINNETE